MAFSRAGQSYVIDVDVAHAYVSNLRFAWDPAKSERTLRERGFDFVYAARIFAGRVVLDEDTRTDYGERRQRATGEVEGLVLRVVFTGRVAEDGQVVRRIISARRASRKERRAYREQAR